MTAALAGLGVLTAALLGVSIAAMVTAKDAHNSVAQLQSELDAAASNTGGAPNGSSSTSGGTAASEAPAVYTSTSVVSPKGYLPAGSLYRGSGGATRLSAQDCFECTTLRGSLDHGHSQAH